MSDTVTVSTADVQVVSAALMGAAQAFGCALGTMPGFSAAMEACCRLSEAVASADMPEDPVSGTRQMAIAYHEMMLGLCDAGFDRTEAFRLVEIQASATAQLGLARALHG
jgi:hypothetical protein